MNLNTRPSKVLNPAYRKFKPLRKDVDLFKEQLTDCLNHIKINEEQNESEENIKKYIGEFLQNSFYQNHLINTKDRIDLAIYLGKDAKSRIGVLLEAKKPSNTAEFLKTDNINRKALQELLLYYLRERVNNENNNIKHLIATNGFEWYLFKGEDFYNYFYKNKKLLKEFKEFDSGKKDSAKTELFYKEIAAKYIAEVETELPFLYINLKDYEKLLDLNNQKDNKLTALYKVFSPVHLLGESFGNDSNQLNDQFYKELLHIIGLEEVPEGGKKVIKRKAKGKRNYGSLLESTIFTLDDRDYLRKVDKLSSFGKTREEQLFNVGLELCLSWVNRILFLKLLEAQLLDFHKDDPNYKFLNSKFISGFDDLEELFFSALAKEMDSRSERIKDRYQYIPYLNSSLFEPTELEEAAMQISNVKDEDLELYEKTILKDEKHKRLSGKLNTLEYLFRFLDAYDFSTEASEEVEESNQSKSLISASVLGLIFEKINGYKDGSFYTPAYITMYMSRETLRRAVIQKFNEQYNWNCKNFSDLKEDLKDYIRSGDRKAIRIEANEIINSLKICDPAVGSGHFLVSALNELIAIKSDLGLLVDAEGERLNIYIELDNDELIIEDENKELFQYKPKDKNAQRIQKTLFHEKQNLIENCLFGVDINPNSVKICRLRLWIELLKNAYYTEEGQLQTLPNIDINIKTGNSLISRFELDDDLKSAFKSKDNPYSLQDYKQAVADYKRTNDKYKKREILKIIDTVKAAFKDSLDSKFLNKLSKARGKYEKKQTEIQNLQAFGEKISKKEKDLLKKLKKAFDKAQAEKEEILNNVIYQNAFEWRFEFPEVLDEDGNFKGFDVVIGNPPYIKEYEGKEIFDGLRDLEVYQGKMDIWYLFGALGLEILQDNKYLSFIAPNNWVTNSGASKFRNKIVQDAKIIDLVDFGNYMIFDSASIQTMVMLFQKNTSDDNYTFDVANLTEKKDSVSEVIKFIVKGTKDEFYKSKMTRSNWFNKPLTFNKLEYDLILDKLKAQQNFELDARGEVAQGVVAPQDFTNKKSAEITGLEVGTGIFNISETEKKNLNLQPKEEELVKPFYTSSELHKYWGNSKNELWVIYTDSSFKNPEKIEPYPNIKKHLDKFQEVITSDNKPYGLHRSREESFFKGEKINSLRKCTEPTFTYTDFDCYVSQSYYVIKTDRVNIKYLLGLFNSKTFKFWLRYRGKMQGNIYQVDKAPLLELPIYIPNENKRESIIEKVNQILTLKKEDPQADTSALEQEIDVLVYKLYGLTYEEVLVVDEGFGEVMGEEEYNQIKLS